MKIVTILKLVKHKALTSEFDAFTNTLDRLLSVSHSEIQKREEEYQKQVARNPRKRGPKPKRQANK
jgi:hypothetical protein